VGMSLTATGAGHAFVYDVAAASPAMRDLGTLGGDDSIAVVGLTPRFVVGQSMPWNRSSNRVFVIDLAEPTPRIRDIGTLGGTASFMEAMSGNVVVGYSHLADPGGIGDEHAFAYDLAARSPRLRDLGTIGRAHTRATGVSGQLVVGFSYNGSPGTFGFRDTPEAFVHDLGGPSPVMRELLGPLGGMHTKANAVSGTRIAGSSTDAAGHQRPTLWTVRTRR
jgi:probable HAF family extracellular repeat protein